MRLGGSIGGGVHNRCVVGHLDCSTGGGEKREEGKGEGGGGEDWTQKLRTQKTTRERRDKCRHERSGIIRG